MERKKDSNGETTETASIGSSWTQEAGSNKKLRVLHGNPISISNGQHTGLSNNAQDVDTCTTITNIDLC